MTSEDRREERLAATLVELTTYLDDGARIVDLGRGRFDSDWLVRRAARNLIGELAETATRLPEQVRELHPQIEWHAIGGMRNRIIHDYQHTDHGVVWDTRVGDLPTLRIVVGRPDKQ
ncbi:MAG: DUF86 domain-containing protein [Actinobacteria bacterium]|nr:DUF86 domain-containing protein [Actinomycetota bacterium]